LHTGLLGLIALIDLDEPLESSVLAAMKTLRRVRASTDAIDTYLQNWVDHQYQGRPDSSPQRLAMCIAISAVPAA